MEYLENIKSKVTQIDVKPYKNWIWDNILYISASVSTLYLLKVSYSSYTSFANKNKLIKDIKQIVQSEYNKKAQREKDKEKEDFAIHKQVDVYPSKNNIDLVNNMIISNKNKENKSEKQSNFEKNNKIKNKDEAEFCYSVYYKCLRTIYSKKFKEFSNQRRKIGLTNIDKYFTYCSEFLESMKIIEDFVITRVFIELAIFGLDKIDEEGTIINDNHLNDISHKYYIETQIDIPNELNLELTNEILICLFDKTKENVKKFITLYSLSQDHEIPEKFFLIAEYLAYDAVFEKYGYSEDQIRKSIVNHELTYKIIKKK